MNSRHNRQLKSGAMGPVLAAVIVLSSAAVLVAQPAVRRPGPNQLVATLPGFSVEYPKKDWQPIPGVGSSLIVFVHKTREANVAIEQRKVPPLAPGDIVDLTARLEGEDWQARRPQPTTFTHRIQDMAGARLIVIDFVQTGAQGPERVRLYALPRGADWFRVICTAPQASFEKYSSTFQSIALSLIPAQ